MDTSKRRVLPQRFGHMRTSMAQQLGDAVGDKPIRVTSGRLQNKPSLAASVVCLLIGCHARGHVGMFERKHRRCITAPLDLLPPRELDPHARAVFLIKAHHSLLVLPAPHELYGRLLGRIRALPALLEEQLASE